MSRLIIVTDSNGECKSYQLAGLGGRAYAFAIDWHIRLLLVLLILTLYFLTHLPAEFVGLDTFMRMDFSWSKWVALAIFFLYHPILEVVMDGSTPGKRIAKIRIVDNRCKPASIAALIGRNVLRPFDAFPGIYTVGILFVFFTKHVIRMGDMMAQTLLIYTHRIQVVSLEVVPAQEISVKDLDSILELLKKWDKTGCDQRVLLASQILQKVGRSTPLGVPDQQLERRLRAQLKSIAQQHNHHV